MKKVKFTIVAILWLLPIIASAQDVITTTEGTDIQGKVFKITKKSVKYIDSNTADTSKGVLHTIAKKDVFSIKYETGVKEVFNHDKYVDDNDSEGHWDKKSMSQQGRDDAQDYYHKFKGAKGGTYVMTTFCGGIIGLIPAIAMSSTAPKESNLGYPDDALWENSKYRRAYKKEAKHIKSKKVWGGYLLGIATDVACGIIWVVI